MIDRVAYPNYDSLITLAAWAAAGRAGAPRIVALTYYSLGDEVEDRSYQYLRHYYGSLGQYAEMVASSALRSPDALRGALTAFADIGVDELVLNPTVADINQIYRLADVVSCSDDRAPTVRPRAPGPSPASARGR